MDEEQTVIPDPLSRNQIMQMAMVVEGLLIPGAILIGWWGGFDPLDKLALTRVDLIWGVAGGLGLALLVVAVLALPLQPVRAFRELMDGQVNPMLAASTYPDRLGIALLAGSSTLHARAYGVNRTTAVARGPNGNVAVASRTTVAGGRGYGYGAARRTTVSSASYERSLGS